jgi:threonine dehydrogenase-like Zn-dependent dehydrogenase
MEALLFTEAGEMRLSEVPDPVPGGDEVVVQVGAAGICGSDLEGFRHPDGLRKPPLIMGHEIAGVLKDGRRVVVNPLLSCGHCRLCLAGQRQLCRQGELIGIHRPGGFAELVTVPTSACQAIPDELSLEAAVFIEPLANALHALARLCAQGQDLPARLGIIGAGAIGLALALAATDAGVESVTVTDLRPERRASAELLGVETSLELEGEHEAIVDAVGAAETRGASIACLAPGGVALWIGLASPDAAIDSRDLIRRECTVVGSYAYSDADFEAAIARAAHVPQRWIEPVPLEKSATRFMQLAQSPGGCPKAVIVPKLPKRAR